MIIKSPFNYTGSKHSILPQLLPLFPSQISTCYDVFGGGGSVSMNVKCERVLFNDIIREQVALIEYLYKTPTKDFVDDVHSCINEYGLTQTSKYSYAYYGCDSTKGVGNYNKTQYLKLREDYNKGVDKGDLDLVKLYTLIVFAFNNQLRVNSKGFFNSPVGKRDFNSSMEEKLVSFMDKIKTKEIIFSSKDFRALKVEESLEGQDDFFYFDPPYLITTATYNERSGWTDNDERELLSLIDKIDKEGKIFGLSNVLYDGDRKNTILIDWLKERKFYINLISKTYKNSNYQKRGGRWSTKEVYVTNYKKMTI